MARIRTIKPRMWESEQLANVTLAAHLLFIGLISNADDEGRLRAKTSNLLESVFPERADVTEDEVEQWMWELAREGLIVVYGGRSRTRRYLQIVKWNEHQRIQKRQPSNYPAPGGQNPIIEPPRMQGFPIPSRVPVPIPAPERVRNDSRPERKGEEIGERNGKEEPQRAHNANEHPLDVVVVSTERAAAIRIGRMLDPYITGGVEHIADQVTQCQRKPHPKKRKRWEMAAWERAATTMVGMLAADWRPDKEPIAYLWGMVEGHEHGMPSKAKPVAADAKRATADTFDQYDTVGEVVELEEAG